MSDHDGIVLDVNLDGDGDPEANDPQEPDDDGSVVCSIKDDGAGFDPGAVAEGVGLSRSVRGRIAPR